MLVPFVLLDFMKSIKNPGLVFYICPYRMIGNIPAMLYSTVFIKLSPNLIGHKHKTHHSKTKQGVPYTGVHK